jgi:hypothetical protein
MRAFAFALSLALVAGCNDNTNKQNQAIGSPCTTSGQCGTGKFFCDLGHPNGYCKADCHKDADCPTGSVCAGAGLVSPGECHKACPNGAADCRTAEGYICKMMPDDASAQYCDVPEPAGDGGA